MILAAIINYIRYLIKKLKEHAVSAFSAQTAFFSMMSFFPFSMLLMTLIQYLPITENALVAVVRQMLPGEINTYVISLIGEIYSHSATTIISLSVIAAIWSASKGFLGIINGFNFIHGLTETRNYLKLRLTAAFYTLIFAVILVVTLMILVFGNRIFLQVLAHIPVLQELGLLIISIRSIAGLGLLFIFFLALYIFVPNQKSGFFAEAPGAAIASIGWVGFSYAYSVYIDHFVNFNTYGSLTVIVLTMLWLYICMYILFIGCEINETLRQTKLMGRMKSLYLEHKETSQ